MTRAILPLDLPTVARAGISAPAPRVVMIDPRRLTVDDAYQRGLSRRSVELIARIVAGWDWARFKPPVAAEVEGELHLIDGQHTAIAAVTHGGLPEIPVMIVEAASAAARAKAFVGHNRDRLIVTPIQIYFAELAAGDAEALTTAQVCARAGVKILRSPPSYGVFRPGDTVAITTVRKLVRNLGAMRARVVLEVMVKAKCAPIGADLINAVSELIYGAHAGTFSEDDLAFAIRGFGGLVPVEVAEIARARRMPLWRAFVIHLVRLGGRRGASAAA